jgi:hypothetical protein
VLHAVEVCEAAAGLERRLGLDRRGVAQPAHPRRLADLHPDRLAQAPVLGQHRLHRVGRVSPTMPLLTTIANRSSSESACGPAQLEPLARPLVGRHLLDGKAVPRLGCRIQCAPSLCRRVPW